MRRFLPVVVLGCGLSVWAQNAPKPDNSAPPSQPPNQTAPANTPPAASAPAKKPAQQSPPPNLAPPRPDSIHVSELGDEPGESSSKDNPVDLSPPADDTSAHPKSAEAVRDAEGSADTGEVGEFRPWDPHKAAKDIEVGDFYFKRRNYVAAESRYREALYYKENDAIATFRLAQCLEKMDRPDEASQEYESYLKILPYGPEAPEAKKAIERLKRAPVNEKPSR